MLEEMGPRRATDRARSDPQSSPLGHHFRALGTCRELTSDTTL